jgi:ABC-2 type transport system permease protein
VYSIIALNYSFGCLFSDRKTREILFWRSLPLSEANNLRGKLMTLCISLPLLISLASLVVWLLIVFSGAIYAGDLGLVWQWLFGPESGSLMWFWLLLLFPLFLLPLTSWALFMSALVKNHPGVLGILLPLAILSVEAWLRFHWEIVIGFHPVLQSYVDAIEAYIVFLDGDNFLSWISVESGLWQLLCKSLVVAVIFIAAALWLRNKRYEI